MKVSELMGEALDYWVARAEGYENERPRDGQMIKKDRRILVGVQDGEAARYEFSPSNNWYQGGPIIERERICIRPAVGWWAAFCGATQPDEHGDTPLIAAMRAYVASKYGETVPDEVAK